MRTNSILFKLFFIAVILWNSGCSTIEPWQRGTLAKPEMTIDPNPKLNHLRDHIFTSREASQGGAAGNGGGCGCN